jgi:hypothetical protein
VRTATLKRRNRASRTGNERNGRRGRQADPNSKPGKVRALLAGSASDIGADRERAQLRAALEKIQAVIATRWGRCPTSVRDTAGSVAAVAPTKVG